MNTFDAARAYWLKGYAPIPIGRGKKSPDDRRGWQDERHDEAAILDQFEESGNVGLLLGEPSGFLVDVDIDAAEALAVAPFFLPPTKMVSGRPSSPRSHWWYRSKAKTEKFRDVADDVSKTAGKAMLVELRAGPGLQTVVPPSTHPSGEPYEFDAGAEPPGRDAAMTDAKRLRRAVAKVATAASLVRRWPAVGVRHDAHLALAGMLLLGGIPAKEAGRIVEAVAHATGAEDVKKHVRKVADTERAIAAGEHVTGGTTLAGLLRGDGGRAVRAVKKWLELKAEPAAEGVEDTPAPPLSDESLALQFAAEHADLLRYCKQTGWLRWEGGCWVSCEKLEEVSRVRRMLRRVATKLDKPAAAKKLASGSTVATVERLARSDDRLVAAQTEFDRDPWLLNTPGGSIDLHTGELRPHRRDDLCTKTTAVAPGGDYPRWLGFIDEVTAGDEELAQYLQRLAGYCLTGSVQEHAFFVFYGPGGNGKGVFVDTLRDVLGTYGRVAVIESFLETKHPQHPTDMAALMGARMVSTSEPAEGVTWDEGKVKRVTGGAPIAARFMRKDFFEFQPEFKLIVEANNQPRFRKVDKAVRRRLQIVPFTVTFGAGGRPEDQSLKERLRAEWGGVLSWAVEGCRLWQEAGLAPPEAVRRETESYLDEEDVLGRWLSERCEQRATERDAIARLWTDFKKWLEQEEITGWTKKRMGAELRQRGFQEAKLAGGVRGLAGLTLRTNRGFH